MIKPERLRPGDKVAAVTLSWGGAGAFPARYRAGKRQMEEEFGLVVIESEHALADPDWIARNPAARADDLMTVFSDPEIRGVVSTIGGDDSIRLLPHVDLDVLRANPKVFVGYSDTTVTHFLCRKAGFASFYGPAVMAGFAENSGMFPYLAESFRSAVFQPEPMGEILPNTDGMTVEFLDWRVAKNESQRRKLEPCTGWRWLQGSGVAEGPLIGGCGDVLEFMKGTWVWPAPDEWAGTILFLETSEDGVSPAHFVWWLRNYAAQGILGRVAGIILGRPGGQIPASQHAEYDEAILRIVAEEEGLDLPIVTGMDFGHTDPFFTLPMGVRARIDCEERRFSIVEAAVC